MSALQAGLFGKLACLANSAQGPLHFTQNDGFMANEGLRLVSGESECQASPICQDFHQRIVTKICPCALVARTTSQNRA